MAFKKRHISIIVIDTNYFRLTLRNIKNLRFIVIGFSINVKKVIFIPEIAHLT